MFTELFQEYSAGYLKPEFVHLVNLNQDFKAVLSP